MKINIGGQKPDAKPATTLAEKASSFQFKKPEIVSSSQPAKQQAIQQGTDKPNANTVQTAPRQTQHVPTSAKTTSPIPIQIAHQSNTPANNIPEMSDDKYEVVAGASDSFSQEAGNKFEEQLGILQSAIDGVGDLREGMVNVLTFLDDNPQYKDNIAPKDIAVFVAACRKVAGITVTEKKTRVTKRKSTSALEADIMADLAGLDLEL